MRVNYNKKLYSGLKLCGIICGLLCLLYYKLYYIVWVSEFGVEVVEKLRNCFKFCGFMDIYLVELVQFLLIGKFND